MLCKFTIIITMAFTLYPHQVEGIGYLKKRLNENLGGALFMEMRCGKSLTFLRFSKEEKDKLKAPIIISAPANVCTSWVIAIIQDSEEYGNMILEDVLMLPRQEVLDTLGICIQFEGTKAKKAKALARSKELGHRYFIVTHASLRLIDWGFKPSCLVVDESVILAKPGNGYTKHAMKFPAEYKYVLTGNPIPESPLQAFMQMKFVQGKFYNFEQYYSFLNACFYQKGFKQVPKTRHEAGIIKAMTESGFVKTLKELNLGNKVNYQIIEVEMSPLQAKYYGEMVDNWETGEMVADYIMVQQLYLQRICGGYYLTSPTTAEFISDSKLNAILELMENRENSEPIMIWCKFIAEIDYIMDRLTQAGYKGYKGSGSTSASDDDKARRAFNARKLDFVVVQQKKFAMGTSWAGGSTMVFYSNEWSNNFRSQAVARMTLIGKETPTTVIDLCCIGSVDLSVVKALKTKDFDSKKLMSEARYIYMNTLAKGKKK